MDKEFGFLLFSFVMLLIVFRLRNRKRDQFKLYEIKGPLRVLLFPVLSNGRVTCMGGVTSGLIIPAALICTICIIFNLADRTLVYAIWSITDWESLCLGCGVEEIVTARCASGKDKAFSIVMAIIMLLSCILPIWYIFYCVAHAIG
jgi:hypothetical protein